MKQLKKVTVIVAIVMLPAWVFAANKFAPAAAVAGENSTVVVPLTIANADGVIAIDIPLKFSEGVTLKEVTFEGTRVEHFDLKIAKIENDKQSVVIGLIHQLSPDPRAPLSAGEGTVANLVFEINNPSVTEIRIEENETSSPAHDLVFIYNTRSRPGQIAFDEVHPDFAGVSVALSGVNGALPAEYALAQNYPNPFNPSTQIGFALPTESEVELSVFNILGQKVTTLTYGKMPAGNHTVTWNGTDADGGAVASGIYFYRITANNFVETKKMMLLK
ncbi:MAG: FlgD immunoglobulin-like domain containing protein [Candidatus Zixiibacteriota bacterium]